MKRFKQVTAVTMAVSLAAAGSLTAFAEDGSLSGDGQVEGTIEKDVYNVILPTVSDTDTTFDFILDPEGLIAATGGAAHGGDASAFDADSTLFFTNLQDDGSKKYSKTSDALKVTNKSNIPVDITLNATIEAPDGIGMVENDSFTDDESTSLYLALTDGTNTAPITAAGASITAEMAKAPEDAYEVIWEADKGYHYELTSAAKDPGYTGFEEYSFNLTGACNTKGNWEKLKDATPAVTVVWSVSGQFSEKAPSIATTSYAMVAGSDVVVNMNLGGGDLAATGISSIQYKNSSGKTTSLAAANYTVSGSTLTFLHSYTDGLTADRTFTIIFNDDAKTTVEITLTK